MEHSQRFHNQKKRILHLQTTPGTESPKQRKKMVDMSSLRLPRFQAWGGCFAFSVVCLGSHVSADTAVGSVEQWVTAALSISMILSFFGIVAYLFAKGAFENTPAEGGLAFLLFVFWCCSLPFIMNPDNNIAVSTIFGIPDVVNANLYFFSWVCFICVVFVLGDYSQQQVGANVYDNTPPKTAKWFALAASSMVVLASAIEFYVSADCSSGSIFRGTNTCKRTNFAIALGVLTFLLTVAFSAMSVLKKLTAMLELFGASIVLIFYIFGVAFVTFGSGPGSAIGNLYFSIWISFVVSILLATQCIRDYYAAQGEASSPDISDGDDVNKTSL